METQALIGLGSNLGDREATLERAIAALAAAPGVAVRAVSSLRETRPVGGSEGQGAFLNAAALLDSALNSGQLLDLLNSIEAAASRVRKVRWEARTLDLDLLLFGDHVLDTPRLILPHPWMALRRFVLAPACEVAPAAIDPVTSLSIADLLSNLNRRPSAVAIQAVPGPFREAVFSQVLDQLKATTATSPDTDRSSDAWHLIDGLPSRPFQDSISLTAEPSASHPLRLHRPTFAVILDSALAEATKTMHRGIPRLRIESRNPEHVVSEIVAACEATRS